MRRFSKCLTLNEAFRLRQAVLGEILLSAYGNEDPFFKLDGIPFVSTGYDTAKVVWDKPGLSSKSASKKVGWLFFMPYRGQDRGCIPKNP